MHVAHPHDRRRERGSRALVITGQMRQGDEPDWLPLEQVLGSDDLCGYFMWMFDVELDDGTILNAYKHRSICARRSTWRSQRDPPPN